MSEVYSSAMAEAAINRLPHDLVQEMESFHLKCMLHLAKANDKGWKHWNSPDVDRKDIEGALAKAITEGDWTSVANYAAFMQYHGFTASR